MIFCCIFLTEKKEIFLAPLFLNKAKSLFYIMFRKLKVDIGAKIVDRIFPLEILVSFPQSIVNT